jgi:hypothetical protein
MASWLYSGPPLAIPTTLHDLLMVQLWQHQGERAEAHALLAPVYGWFTAGFGTADLQEAKVLLEVFV